MILDNTKNKNRSIDEVILIILIKHHHLKRFIIEGIMMIMRAMLIV
jgi:hypothetical protein